METIAPEAIPIVLGKNTTAVGGPTSSHARVMAYGPTREAAISAIRALALRVAADCIDHGEKSATIWECLLRRMSRWPR